VQIKYKNESKLISLAELRSGDVFVWDENAWIILDCLDYGFIPERPDTYLCARLSDGHVEEFNADDCILPRIQSLLEVKIINITSKTPH